MLKRLGHDDALAIDFGDNPDATRRIVVIPGESIKFAYDVVAFHDSCGPVGRSSARCYPPTMSSVRARVKNGRLVLDEPTDLPEGTEVELLAVDEVDDLDPAERARLYGFLAESIRTHVPGTGTPASALLAELRSR